MSCKNLAARWRSLPKKKRALARGLREMDWPFNHPLFLSEAVVLLALTLLPVSATARFKLGFRHRLPFNPIEGSSERFAVFVVSGAV